MAKKILMIMFGLFLMSGRAFSDAYLSAVPTSWLLQNYIPNTVVVWFTGSTCTNGGLALPSAATDNDRNRLFSMIMAAKASGKTLIVYYDNTSTPGSCFITSFGMNN